MASKRVLMKAIRFCTLQKQPRENTSPVCVLCACVCVSEGERDHLHCIVVQVKPPLDGGASIPDYPSMHST